MKTVPNVVAPQSFDPLAKSSAEPNLQERDPLLGSSDLQEQLQRWNQAEQTVFMHGHYNLVNMMLAGYRGTLRCYGL